MIKVGETYPLHKNLLTALEGRRIIWNLRIGYARTL